MPESTKEKIPSIPDSFYREHDQWIRQVLGAVSGVGTSLNGTGWEVQRLAETALTHFSLSEVITWFQTVAQELGISWENVGHLLLPVLEYTSSEMAYLAGERETFEKNNEVFFKAAAHRLARHCHNEHLPQSIAQFARHFASDAISAVEIERIMRAELYLRNAHSAAPPLAEYDEELPADIPAD